MVQEGNCLPAQIKLTVLSKSGKKMSRQDILLLGIFQKDVWVSGIFFAFPGYFGLKKGFSTAGFTPLPKTPLESQKNRLLTSQKKLIWHITPILFALT